jgi:hypothetical protein
VTVTVVDVPAFLEDFRKAAAGEGGYVPMIPANLTDLEAARDCVLR